MNKLRKELYLLIKAYGNLDPRTIKKSQELDVEIVKEQRKRALSRAVNID